MPKAVISPDEIYHIFNRGVNKQFIFLENADYIRMLFLIIVLQSTEPFYNPNRYVKNFLKHGDFDFSGDFVAEILNNRTVELTSFVLMPNHFHLIIKELKENGISEYLRRIEIAYTKYFNVKYRRSGYLLQGPFQSVHVSTNEQLLHLSAYIHRNPREISGWKNKEDAYPWSSYKFYKEDNYYAGLLMPNIILEQFKDFKEYRDFVETSGAKDLNEDTKLDLDI